MKQLVYAVLFSLAVSLLMHITGAAQQPDDVNLRSKAITFVQHLAAGEFERATAEFDSVMLDALPTRRVGEIWTDLLSSVGEFTRIENTRLKQLGEYDIVLVTTVFENATLDVKIVYDREQEIGGLWFVPTEPEAEYELPTYADTSSFSESEVKVGKKPWILPATLSVPHGEGPFPAVVLVHGSGPNDRDESMGPNKPFRDLAVGLASNGVAVLRYEKRTRAFQQKMADERENLTVKEETIDDALLAVQLLKENTRIDPGQIFVLGHSLGGTLIPRIALADTSIAGFIIMAGATRPLEDLVVEQTEYIFNLDDSLSEFEKQQLTELRKQTARVKDTANLGQQPSDSLPFGVAAAYWLDLSTHSPAREAASIHSPILVLQGGRDYQVTARDYDLWKQGLADHDDAEFHFYPELNHLFIAGEGRSSPDEYNKPGHVAQKVITDIAAFVNK